MVDTNILTIGPVSGIGLISNRPCLLQNGGLWANKPVLKTTLNVSFQRFATQRVVSGVR